MVDYNVAEARRLREQLRLDTLRRLTQAGFVVEEKGERLLFSGRRVHPPENESHFQVVTSPGFRERVELTRKVRNK